MQYQMYEWRGVWRWPLPVSKGIYRKLLWSAWVYFVFVAWACIVLDAFQTAHIQDSTCCHLSLSIISLESTKNHPVSSVLYYCRSLKPGALYTYRFVKKNTDLFRQMPFLHLMTPTDTPKDTATSAASISGLCVASEPSSALTRILNYDEPLVFFTFPVVLVFEF